MPSIDIHLRRGREKPIAAGHPWVFSGAIEHAQGDDETGAVANVFDAAGTWLARGLFHRSANLSVRLYTRDPDEALDATFFRRRIERAISWRERVQAAADPAKPTDAWRLIFSEADGLSGLIVDRYADVLVVEFAAGALVPHADMILDLLRERTGLQHVHVTADGDNVEREALDADALNAKSSSAEKEILVRENGFAFTMDLEAGHKTGCYLDQRVNRLRVAAYARDRRVLSAYCYTGAFEVYAAAAGAQTIVGLDSNASVLERARAHHALNHLTVPTDYRKANVGDALRRFRDSRETFDMIVLDPPRFVSSRAQKPKGLRAYKDINMLAMKLLTPDGILATFSCSGLVSPEDLLEVLRWAAQDAGREVQIAEALGQPADHPVAISFPEGAYLKGYICRVL